jgi:hypothetical protein
MPTNTQGQPRPSSGGGQRQGQQQQGTQQHEPGGRKPDAVERVAESAQSSFATARQKVTDQISAVVRAVERASDELQREDQRGLANRVQQLARRAESASTYLQDKSPRELKHDLDDLARRKPAWVLGGAFVAGIAAARFLKSSERTPVAGGGGRYGAR